MDFYDLCVRVDENLDEIVEIGKRFGFSGLGIVHEYSGKEGLDAYLDRVKRKREESDLDLVSTCEINAESPKDLKKKLGEVRQKVEIVAVRGGDFDINKNAVRDSRVDLLIHPEYKRKDSGMDHKTTRMASENDVAIGMVLHPLFQTYGKVRSHVLNHLRRNLKLCEKYNAIVIVGSGARDKYGLRDPRELASLPNVLQMDLNQSMETVSSNPLEMVEENRSKLEGKRREGVEEVY